MSLVKSGSPGGITVPWQDPQLAFASVAGRVVGVKVVSHVLVGTGPEVVAPDCFGEAVIKGVFLEVDMFADKGLTAVSSQGVFNGVVVRAVGRCEGSLVSLLSLPAFFLIDQLVEISFGQSVFFEKADVIGFDNILQAPEVTTPLIRSFFDAVDDP